MRTLPNPPTLKDAVLTVIESNTVDGYYPPRFVEKTQGVLPRIS